jgi:hypothetical protein
MFSSGLWFLYNGLNLKVNSRVSFLKASEVSSPGVSGIPPPASRLSLGSSVFAVHLQNLTQCSAAGTMQTTMLEMTKNLPCYWNRPNINFYSYDRGYLKVTKQITKSYGNKLILFAFDSPSDFFQIYAKFILI